MSRGQRGSRCLPGHPRRVPSPVGARHRPHELCGAVPGAAPPNRAPDSTKISTLPAQPWADTALLTSCWAPFVPPSTSPGPPRGSSLPGHSGGRIFTSLNRPWLQVLWAAASLMPRARASQCSPVADWQHEPGRREASKHGRHFLGVSVLLPRLHHARMASGAHPWPGQRGDKEGTRP